LHFEFQYPLLFLLLLPILCIYLCPASVPKRYFVHIAFFRKTTNYINKEKLLFASILLLIVTALTSPISYEQKSPNHRKGRDLVIALDTSGSMGESGYDQEHKHNRKFDTVLEILDSFIRKRFDDNLGVVVFGNFAFATAPLTYDRTSLSYVLKYLDVGIAGDNTAIGDGIMHSIRVLQESQTDNKVIILLSDGYQNSGTFSPKDGVNLAIKEHIKIYTIGIGKSSDFDEALLKEIAQKSGGRFFQADSAESMRKVYNAIDTLEPSPIRSEHYLHKTLLFDIPLSIAIFLLSAILLKRQQESAL